jgi:Fic family protein
LSETALVIDKGMTVSGKSLRERLEAINHYQAVLLLKEFVHDEIPLTEHLIKQFHALISQSIDPKNAGVYRLQAVSITGVHISHLLILKCLKKWQRV